MREGALPERNINFLEGDPLWATSSPSEGRQTGGEINRDGRRAAQDLSDKGVGVAQRTNKSRRGMKKGPTKVKTAHRDRQRCFQPGPVRYGATTEICQGVSHDIIKGRKSRLNQVRSTRTEHEGDFGEGEAGPQERGFHLAVLDVPQL